MFLKAVAAALLLIGVLMSGFGIYFIGMGYEAEGWTKVEGRVVSATVRVDITSYSTQASEARRQELRRYYPSITYEWAVGSETFSGSRYRLGETHQKYEERADAEAASAKFRAGEPITVYYNADHPGQAVLDPSLSAAVFVPLPLGLLFLWLGWLVFRNRDRIEAASKAGGAQ